jgi:hypothetical protein
MPILSCAMRAHLPLVVLAAAAAAAGCDRNIDLGGAVDDLGGGLWFGLEPPANPPACPLAAPGAGSACGFTGLACSFGLRSCICGGDGAWACCDGEPPLCPLEQPLAGDTCCPTVPSPCYYGGCSGGLTTTCECVGGRFQCGTQTCPMGGSDLAAVADAAVPADLVLPSDPSATDGSGDGGAPGDGGPNDGLVLPGDL